MLGQHRAQGGRQRRLGTLAALRRPAVSAAGPSGHTPPPSPPAHLAVSNSERTAASDSPSHFCSSSGPLTLRKLAPQQEAAARASSVLPQPGGP